MHISWFDGATNGGWAGHMPDISQTGEFMLCWVVEGTRSLFGGAYSGSYTPMGFSYNTECFGELVDTHNPNPQGGYDYSQIDNMPSRDGYFHVRAHSSPAATAPFAHAALPLADVHGRHGRARLPALLLPGVGHQRTGVHCARTPSH